MVLRLGDGNRCFSCGQALPEAWTGLIVCLDCRSRASRALGPS
jgi:DNA-directed RNA polymerase subunit N (RpoN/RPB10)